MKIIKKVWTPRGFGSGFGDLINHISYEHRQAKESTIIKWRLQPRTNRQVRRVLSFLKKHPLVEHQFGDYIEEDEIPYSQQDHEYWECKQLHNPHFEKYCAIWLYTKHIGNSPHHQDKVVGRYDLERLLKDLKDKGYKVVLIPNLKNSGGETIYDIDYNFDQYAILIQSILKNCTFSICSEGGIAHLSRSMKVPTICYFHQTMPWKGHDFDLKDFWTGDLYRPCNDVIDSEQLFRDICSNK
jgi:ADP-heptose:LPS heptosyltransferase|tara:strand:- start:228 stop:950 length:723 start_codon:yes stop_codon:yes gene_type:complete